MSKKKKSRKAPKANNLVAKHAHKFNKSTIMRDKKNNYSRKVKNKKADLSSAFYFGMYHPEVSSNLDFVSIAKLSKKVSFDT